MPTLTYLFEQSVLAWQLASSVRDLELQRAFWIVAVEYERTAAALLAEGSSNIKSSTLPQSDG
jgi:hypothetical protein